MAVDIPLDAQYLRDHAATRGFMLGRPVSATPTPDGKAVLFLRSQPRATKMELYEFNATTRDTRLLLTAENLLNGAAENLSAEEKARRERMRISVGGLASFQLSHDGSQVLLPYSGKLYILERDTGKVEELKIGAGTLLDPRFSPDGRSVAFVRDQDVYVYDLLKHREKRVTKGGTELISHGLAEFVAQEEMFRYSGYWWSPDSKQIAYEEADANGVEIWYVADSTHPERAPLPSYYPRPGKANVKVRLGVISARGGGTIWINWDRDHYPYLAKVDWTKSGGLTLVVQSRDQHELVLLRADLKTGQTTALVEERDPAWVNIDPQMPRWLDDGTGFLWTSDRDGGPQLELRDTQGGIRRVLVPPTVGYQSLDTVNEAAGSVVFNASVDPTQSHLFRVPLAGGAAEQLTEGTGVFSASFGRQHNLEVRAISKPDAMPVTTVFRADGQVIAALPSVAETPPFVPRAETLKIGDGEGFYAEVVRPRNFDASRRYPVVVDVYGGPHHKSVSDTMQSRLLNQWLADQGFIVCSVDNRGTPGRGRAWERAVYRKFGSVPLEDQVAGVKALGQRFPEMDTDRVGIVGWSFGGYMSALAVLRAPDFFKAAVAGAPVTDWYDYDTHYTERYMGVPTGEDAAYKDGSLFTFASGLRRPLLLVHGTADDNVYFRHTLRLTDALFRAGREFEVLPLPSLTHMVPDPVVMENLWSRVAGHFKRHLGEPTSTGK